MFWHYVIFDKIDIVLALYFPLDKSNPGTHAVLLTAEYFGVDFFSFRFLRITSNVLVPEAS